MIHEVSRSWTLTPGSSPCQSPTPSRRTSKHEETMENWSSSRPTSLAVPPTSHPGPRPTLDDVLSDRALPPYTLTAFMAYLSQNHCLETLEFTMDAKRYGEHYTLASQELFESPIMSEGPKSQHLCALFQRLLTAYVVPGAPREINLPSTVRDGLLRYSNSRRPPPPSTVDAAVKRMRDLMDESIFIPFLNSRSPAPQQHREGIPTEASYGGPTTSVTSQHPAAHHAPHLITGQHRHHTSTHGSTSGDSASGNLTDDSGSSPSSPGGGIDPVTPPTTPPSSELHSPRGGGRQDNTWKKMGMKFGWKK